PNRRSDAICIYCRTSIVEDTGLLAWLRQTYYVLRWRWQLQKKREDLKDKNLSSGSFPRSLGFFLLGAGLTMVGLYLFTLSLAGSSFSNALIGTLFLLYGIFTLRSLFLKK
ncbi:MAG: hypothetical protein ACE5ER_05315, partial [Nitrospinaceae bacterium]